MTVGKKMNRIVGQHVVEIDADIGKLAKDRRGKAELRSEEITGALMGQDHSHAARHFFADSTKDEANDLDRLTGIQALASRLGPHLLPMWAGTPADGACQMLCAGCRWLPDAAGRARCH